MSTIVVSFSSLFYYIYLVSEYLGIPRNFGPPPSRGTEETLTFTSVQTTKTNGRDYLSR